VGKTRAKKPRRKRKPRQARSGSKTAASPVLWVTATAIAMCVLLWLAYAGFDDRHWSAFQDAGDRAYGRGNYAYAQRMYHEALQEAERLDPRGEELVQTLLALSRAHKASGEQTLADAMLTRARAVRAQRKR
jgi:hypothetical protein